VGKGCRFFYEALCIDSGRTNVKDVNTIKWTRKKKRRFKQAYSRKDDSSYGTVATNESMSGTSSACKPVKS